jgi:hypothetical protein
MKSRARASALDRRRRLRRRGDARAFGAGTPRDVVGARSGDLRFKGYVAGDALVIGTANTPARGEARPFRLRRPVAPIQRAPLPPFDHDTIDPDTGAPLPVHTTLNGTIPPLSDTSYHRANLWGMTLSGCRRFPPARAVPPRVGC